MRYKSLVTRKLEELDNIILGLKSLLSSNASREQIENQFTKSKEKIEDIQTLINVEVEG
jgi:hypothetical protein